MRTMLSLASFLVTTWLASSASAQGIGEHRVLFVRGDGGTYQLTGPNGRVAASGTFTTDDFIEVGWWRNPGTYTFATSFAGVRAETSVTLDGTEHDLIVGRDAGSNLAIVVWRQSPSVTATWLDEGHLTMRNDTDRDLSVGTHRGRVLWEHRPAEQALSPSERARRTFHATVECGTGFGSLVVPAHGSVEVAVDMNHGMTPGEYHGAIRLEPGGVVVTFETTVVADHSPGGGHLTQTL